ncbi:MAG: ABC transporter permease [Bacillota bacterium]|nr:ABC transporter permease [Bacillota bacterium]
MEHFIDALSLLFGENSELRRIILVTLQMSLTSTSISVLIGMPLGVLIGSRRFPGKRHIIRITQTLMGLPPVVAGLIVFLILSRSGPLGSLKLLYTVSAMVIAQVVLLTPIVCGLTTSLVAVRAPQLLETTRGFGMSRRRELWLLLFESRIQLISVMMMAFGRAIAEVGAVQIVGGNIQFKTRVMTTAIMLETNKGNFQYAVALGVVLLLISLIVNSLAQRMQEDADD